MPALSDPKLEKFAQQLLRNLANDMSRSKAAEVAAKEAGYAGSSLGSNARKRASRPDVKARVRELAAPAQAAMQVELGLDIERAERRLAEIILAEIDLSSTKPADVIAAIRQLAAMRGWEAREEKKLDVNVFNLLSFEDQRIVVAALETVTGGRLPAGSGVEGESPPN